MKYNAMDATKRAFSGRKFEITTVKNTPNDLVNQLATSWFTQEKALKKWHVIFQSTYYKWLLKIRIIKLHSQI